MLDFEKRWNTVGFYSFYLTVGEVTSYILIPEEIFGSESHPERH